jgi:hypothetical protein
LKVIRVPPPLTPLLEVSCLQFTFSFQFSYFNKGNPCSSINNPHKSLVLKHILAHSFNTASVDRRFALAQEHGFQPNRLAVDVFSSIFNALSNHECVDSCVISPQDVLAARAVFPTVSPPRPDPISGAQRVQNVRDRLLAAANVADEEERIWWKENWPHVLSEDEGKAVSIVCVPNLHYV